jgi:hypothetical protein
VRAKRGRLLHDGAGVVSVVPEARDYGLFVEVGEFVFVAGEVKGAPGYRRSAR